MSDNDEYGAELDDIVQQTELKIEQKQENQPKPGKMSFLQSAALNAQNTMDDSGKEDLPATGFNEEDGMPPEFEKMMA